MLLLFLTLGCWWPAPAPSCTPPLVAIDGQCCWTGQQAVGGACQGLPTSCPEGWTPREASCSADVRFDTVRVEAGTFTMGCDDTLDSDCAGNAQPRHEVTLTHPMLVMKHELTQAQYVALTGSNPSRLKGCGACPVETVSWRDAVRAANLASMSYGLQPAYEMEESTVRWRRDADGWRLPTEAEWEYAARGGEDLPYAGAAEREAVAWWQGNAQGGPSEVMRKQPNLFGLYDMSGNVWEWVWDRPGRYPTVGVTDPVGPEVAELFEPDASSRGDEHVLRGGAWADFPQGSRVDYRGYITEQHADVVLGFRLVRTLR